MPQQLCKTIPAIHQAGPSHKSGNAALDQLKVEDVNCKSLQNKIMLKKQSSN